MIVIDRGCVSGGDAMFAEFGQPGGVVDAQVLADSRDGDQPRLQRRTTSSIWSGWATGLATSSTWHIRSNPTTMISPKHTPAHFAVAATTVRPWCPDTPDADQRRWRESKEIRRAESHHVQPATHAGLSVRGAWAGSKMGANMCAEWP